MPATRLLIASLACLLVGCDHPTAARGGHGGGSSQFDQGGYGADWEGVFTGAGRGVLGSMMVDATDVRLTIESDPDSVRVLACEGCVTISLDTLFWQPNVFLSDPQSVVLRYEAAGVRRSLSLALFSGSGGTANVVQAGLRIEETGGGSVLADFTYVLER